MASHKKKKKAPKSTSPSKSTPAPQQATPSPKTTPPPPARSTAPAASAATASSPAAQAAAAKPPTPSPSKGQSVPTAPVAVPPTPTPVAKSSPATGAGPKAPAKPPTPTAKPAAPPAPPAPPSVLPPSILLEGDATPPPPVSGPGQRYALSPGPLPSTPLAEPRELPSSYGTRRLILVARDPHWVYAHWDFSDEQLREANRKSPSGALTLRIRAGTPQAHVVVEQPVHPESRNWFIHVPEAGARYLAELGYYDAQRAWLTLATSAATLTPRDALSPETWVRFETLPFDMPMREIVELVKRAVTDQSTPLLEALQQLRREGLLNLPIPAASEATAPAQGLPASEWTPAQERALAEVLSMDEVRRVWIGSLEITELLRRQLQRGISSLELSLPGAAAGVPSGGLSSLSSPFGGAAPGARGFWLNVNAELIVYGATDPHATVTIGNRPIRLRPDGTFSYRFALPDGDYHLPIAATSPDGVERREADLAFQRKSAYRGEVTAHPQDPALRTPAPDHVA